MGLGRFLAGVLVVWGAASTLPGANVRVNVTGTPSEPFSQGESVIVQFNYNDPADLPNLGTQDVILVAWNDQSAPGGIGFGFARSVGGGAFEHTTLAGGGILPAPTGGQGRGDPLLAVDYHADLDGVGNPLVYAAQIANVGLFQDIWLSSSTDGGRTFPSSSTMNISNSPAPGCPSGSGVPKVCDDKPWIAIDQRGGARPADGTVYACWTRISSDGETVTNQVLLAQKPPGGSFGAPIAITPEVTHPANVQACQVAVDIDGHVYVAWREYDDRPKVKLRHAPAPAGAAAPVFDPEVLVDQIRQRLFRSGEDIVSCAAPEWILRFAATFPSLATDPYDGNVYLTWGSWNGPTGGNGPARYDVFFTSLVRPGTRSDLRAPLRVNDDPVGDAVDQYMPSIATYPLPVAPTAIGGETTVMVQWYDKRSSGVANDAFELWADQSPFNTNEPVSDAGPEPVNPPGSDMACRPGDYNAMTSGYFVGVGPDGTFPGPVFLHSWTDTRGAGADDPEVYFQAQPVDTGPPIPSTPPTIVNIRLLNLFTQFPQVFPDIGQPIEIPFDMEFTNEGPGPLTIQSWLSVSVPPGISAGWNPSPGDGCFGPPPQGQRGPLPGTMGLGCNSQELNVLGLERLLLSGGTEYVSRELRITCEQTGVFDLTVTGGTGPVLPIEVQDGDLSDNFGESKVVVTCQPDPRPAATSGLIWNDKSSLSWQPVQAASYHLYRGDSTAFQFLSTGSRDGCLRTTTVAPDTGNVLTELPPVGAFHWYLALAVDGNGLESSAGSGSSGDRLLESVGDCGTCGHDVCSIGSLLSPNCLDPCAGEICAVDPYCCDTSWDALCVEQVRTVCGRATCPDSQGDCAHGLCWTGSALTTSCDDPPITPGCVATVCASDAFCCDPISGQWDLFCVAAVEDSCQLSCE